MTKLKFTSHAKLFPFDEVPITAVPKRDHFIHQGTVATNCVNGSSAKKAGHTHSCNNGLILTGCVIFV